MSVTGTIRQVKREAKRPVDLPTHLETWFVDATVVGDAGGGIVQQPFGFNVSDTTREWYVAVTSAIAGSATPMDVSLDMRISDWLEWEQSSRLVTVNTDGGTVASEASVELVKPNSPIYLGRVQPGEDGEIFVTYATNVDLEVYEQHLRGYISMTPFVIPLTFSR